MRHWVALIAIAAMASPSIGKPPIRKPGAGSRCAALSTAYHTDIETAAKFMQATNREIRDRDFEGAQTNALSRAKIDIDLLKGAGCPLPTDTPDPTKYRHDAQACAAQQFNERYGTGTIPTGCDPQDRAVDAGR